jgi:hypothetical protein
VAPLHGGCGHGSRWFLGDVGTKPVAIASQDLPQDFCIFLPLPDTLP